MHGNQEQWSAELMPALMHIHSHSNKKLLPGLTPRVSNSRRM
jgi:hypothetical protein